MTETKIKIIQAPWAGKDAQEWIDSHPEYVVEDVKVTPGTFGCGHVLYPIVTIKYKEKEKV